MATDKVPQNAAGGGEKDKSRVKPESLGGVSFEELMRQEKGNRDRAALRFNAAAGKPGSTAYSPPATPAAAPPAPMTTAGIPAPAATPAAPMAMPQMAPIPTPRPDNAGIPYAPGGGMDVAGMASLGTPMPPQLTGVPPALDMFAMLPPPQGVPPDLMAQAIPERFGRPAMKGPRLGRPQPLLG